MGGMGHSWDGFNVILYPDCVSLDKIKASGKFDLASLYKIYEIADSAIDSESPLQFGNGSCTYCEPNEFHIQTINMKDTLSFFHLNCRGLSAYWESFRDLICNLYGD